MKWFRSFSRAENLFDFDVNRFFRRVTGGVALHGRRDQVHRHFCG
jgi:hypothetical protein